MKEITPKDSRYVPFVQQQSCCAVTCILMVMYKRGIPLISQELLGYYLGLIVDPKKKHLFWNVRSGKKSKAGYGTNVFLKQCDPNKVFKKFKIPLSFNADHSIEKYKSEKDLIEFMEDSIKKDRDLLVCLNNGTLNDMKKKAGHICVVDKVYPAKNIVRIIDPSPKQPKWRMIKISKLKKAMQDHPANAGGFWELI